MIFYSALSNIIWLSTWRIHYLHILLHYNMYLHHAVIFKWLMNINLIADFVVQFRFKSPIVDHFQGYKVPIINTFCLEDFSKSASSNLFYQGKMVLVMYKRLRFCYVYTLYSLFIYGTIKMQQLYLTASRIWFKDLVWFYTLAYQTLARNSHNHTFHIHSPDLDLVWKQLIIGVIISIPGTL